MSQPIVTLLTIVASTLYLMLIVAPHIRSAAGTKISLRNNVCRSLIDYVAIKINNKNCYYDPDVNASPEQLITRRGYHYEASSVISSDGYILTLFHIKHPLDEHRNQTRRQPVLLQHGVFGAASNFMASSDRSLAFSLADNGFDVWLGCVRGTVYSGGHLTLSMADKQFWDFSFHEMAIHDVPVLIDYVANKTDGAGKIIYIGYSMGVTEALIYATLRKEHANRNLVGVVALAPPAYLGHTKGIAFLAGRFSKLIERIFQILNINVLFPEANPLTRLFRYAIVKVFPLFIVTILVSYVLTGPELKEGQARDFTVLFSSIPSSGSAKTLNHFIQIIHNRGRFQYYDYGKSKNLELYGSIVPPEYDVSKITIPFYMFYGKNDFLATGSDAHKLYDKLTSVENKSVTSINGFSHLNFIIAKHSKQLMIEPVIQVINDKLKRE